jgi:hypothetical protein
MGQLGFGLLALAVFLQLIPVLLVDLLAEAGILVDLILTVSALTWVGSQGNAWLRDSALKRGFKLVQGE